MFLGVVLRKLEGGMKGDEKDCFGIYPTRYALVSSDLWTQIFVSRMVDFPVESPLQSAAQMKSKYTTVCALGCALGFSEKWLISNVLIVYI